MATLSWEIITTSRTNAKTGLTASTKRYTPLIDSRKLPHEYVFDAATVEATAKTTAKSDLQTGKGYTWDSEV